MINKIVSLCFLFFSLTGFAQAVEIRDHQLFVDNQAQPQLFGAEIQYFRLRAGYQANQNREEVIALWNKALDRAVEAKMNAVSFYIPWDFHEYEEGKFDFTGTVDLDQDGRPDYPSRDIITFFKLIENHGITRIMVRPGPYINAEWGFLGFGAIPQWFHDKYPNSHMRTPYGKRSRLYDYHNPDLLRHSQLWFNALNEQVLKNYIGPGKPVIFLQIDNETNYQWQSIYNHDFGPSTIQRYQNFLKDSYLDLADLNKAHGRKWMRWNQIQPPTTPRQNIFEDQDWYKFSDDSIYGFLSQIRNLWEQIDIHEPQVMFTLAESFNAPADGLLPNFILRNDRAKTGMMTVNLYPKTFEESHQPLLNFPFKADFDVKAADEASDAYLGSRQEWVMGPEIQGGWWQGINVTPESRQQTYLTVLGHGLKAFFIYYFNEGENWGVEWAHSKVNPLFENLRYDRRLTNTSLEQLPEDFWNELQAQSDQKILIGLDVRRIIKTGAQQDEELFFDSPLNGQAEPRGHFFDLKKIGTDVIAPYQDFLARSLEVVDDVSLVIDSTSHQPSRDLNLPANEAAADWSGGLLGYLMNANLNPRILHGDISSEISFTEPKALIHLDTGHSSPRTLSLLARSLNEGKTIINFLSSDFTRTLYPQITETVSTARGPGTVALTFYMNAKKQLKSPTEMGTLPVQIFSSSPIYTYDLASIQKNGCAAILFLQDKPVGYSCPTSEGQLVQIGALIFENYNSGAYVNMTDSEEKRSLLQSLLAGAKVQTRLSLSKNSERTVAFARKDPLRKLLWITVKTGTSTAQALRLKISDRLLNETLLSTTKSKALSNLKITDLLSKTTQVISIKNLVKQGFKVELAAHGSTVFVVSF
ncbi:MAG: beta-galactosidase [Bdellovibrionota bacterium]